MNPAFLPPEKSEVISRLSKPVLHGAMGPRSGGTITPEEAQKLWMITEPSSDRRMLYLHIPFCVSRCLFCSFYQNRTKVNELNGYTDYLLREMAMMAGRPAVGGTFNTVYFGGGTPTDLSAADLGRLIKAVRNLVHLSDDVEFTVEGRLLGFDDEKVQACLDAGANRFSFGVQTFNTARRQLMGRRLPREKVIERLCRIKELGGDQACTVIDLIYGLPGQSLEEWLEDIRTVHEDTPLDGVDLYRLKMLPDTPLTKKMGKVPWSDLEQIERQAEGGKYLRDAGWDRLSVTHWGRGGLERNRYNHQTKIGVDTVPFGCGAGGGIGGYSFMQMMELASYQNQLEQGHKPIGMVRPRMPNPLKDRVADQMERCFFKPVDFDVPCDSLIQNWTEAGVWEPDEEGICWLTELGQFSQPRLAMMLTGYLAKGGDGAE
ncbi:MAG: radical SAM protein [Pontiella sp.]